MRPYKRTILRTYQEFQERHSLTSSRPKRSIFKRIHTQPQTHSQRSRHPHWGTLVEHQHPVASQASQVRLTSTSPITVTVIVIITNPFPSQLYLPPHTPLLPTQRPRPRLFNPHPATKRLFHRQKLVRSLQFRGIDYVHGDHGESGLRDIQRYDADADVFVTVGRQVVVV